MWGGGGADVIREGKKKRVAFVWNCLRDDGPVRRGRSERASILGLLRPFSWRYEQGGWGRQAF